MAEKIKPTEVLDEDMQEAAKASAATANKLREEEKKATKGGVGVRRRQGRGPGSSEFEDSDIPYPVEIHGEDFEFYGPQGFAAEIPEDAEKAAYSVEQEFIINPEKIKFLRFEAAGKNLPKKRLYNVKALHRDGRLVQLPFEQQIQNTAGGDPQDAIGLRRYQRKGIEILIDWNSLAPVYCAAWDCFARASNVGQYIGFCSERHARHTLPNKYKDASGITQGFLEQGVTTSRTWSA